MRTPKSKSSTNRQDRSKQHAAPGQGISPGSRILAAIEEATELLQSEGLESKRLTMRTYEAPPPLRSYGSEEVKRVRELLGASQGVLARFLGISIDTLRSWEQGKRAPQPIARRFLSEIESDPGYWRQRLEKRSHASNPLGQNGLE
jgi:putative transcriptional regulator